MFRQTRYANKTRSQRRSRAETLGSSIRRLTKPIYSNRGLADGTIARDWSAIVGDMIAVHSQPEKISYTGRERTNGLLHLRVDSSAIATQLQHLEPQIIERINSHFGYQAVSHLRFLHAPLHKVIPSSRNPKLLKLSNTRELQLEQTLNDIEDPELREALEKLGRAISEG